MRKPTAFFSDIITDRMIHDRRYVLVVLQDKFKFKQLLKLLDIPYFVDPIYVSREPIDLSSIASEINLPQKYVIKANHGCGWNIFVNGNTATVLTVVDYIAQINANGSLSYHDLNNVHITKLTEKWLNMTYPCLNEWAYSQINPKMMMIEEHIEFDYELFAYCTNFEVKMLRTVCDEHTNHRTNHYYDKNWNCLHSILNITNKTHDFLTKPEYLDEIKQVCNKILLFCNVSEVRLDFWCCKNKFYLSEATIYPVGGNKDPITDSYLQHIER